LRLVSLTLAAACILLPVRHTAAQDAARTARRAQSPRAAVGADLVGVWRVEHFCTTDSLGRQHVAFAKPIGYFIYTKDGRVSLQFGPARGTPGASSAVLDSLNMAPSERLSYERGWVAYFGRYTVTSDSTLIHHVEGGTIASYIGTDQGREYRITGPRRDTLAVGDLHPGCRVLVRVE
jgi:hypothetical protein